MDGRQRKRLLLQCNLVTWRSDMSAVVAAAAAAAAVVVDTCAK